MGVNSDVCKVKDLVPFKFEVGTKVPFLILYPYS